MLDRMILIIAIIIMVAILIYNVDKHVVHLIEQLESWLLSS